MSYKMYSDELYKNFFWSRVCPILLERYPNGFTRDQGEAVIKEVFDKYGDIQGCA